MNTTKKTLVVKISHDVSQMSDLSLEFAKMALRLQGMAQGIKSEQIDFEVIKDGTEPTEAEINDGNTRRQEIINFFDSVFGSNEDEDDEDDDDEDEDEIIHDEE